VLEQSVAWSKQEGTTISSQKDPEESLNPKNTAKWEYLKKILFPINKLGNFLPYFLLPLFTSYYPIFSSKLLQ
jgi:hypothetical protein